MFDLVGQITAAGKSSRLLKVPKPKQSPGRPASEKQLARAAEATAKAEARYEEQFKGDKTLTVAVLAARLGVFPNAAAAMMRRLAAKNKAHVVGHEAHGVGNEAALWKWGPKPPAFPQTEAGK